MTAVDSSAQPIQLKVNIYAATRTETHLRVRSPCIHQLQISRTYARLVYGKRTDGPLDEEEFPKIHAKMHRRRDPTVLHVHAHCIYGEVDMSLLLDLVCCYTQTPTPRTPSYFAEHPSTNQCG